ncbi:MAG: DUF2461 domain-containing protein [Pseudomonadales bacterium]
MAEFAGFPRQTLDYLDELAVNNDRDWFQANRHRYEALVREPALDFIAAMGPRLARISEHFEALPKKVGGSLMRVHRDTRFGRDKTPYKTNIGIQFRHELGRDVHAPGFYVHIANDGCFFGAGMWRPDPAALTAIRDRIAFRPQEWQRVREDRALRRLYRLDGEALKRPPRGYPPDHRHLEDLKRKDFIAIAEFSAGAISERRFLDLAARTFRSAAPLMQFLCNAIEVAY